MKRERTHLDRTDIYLAQFKALMPIQYIKVVTDSYRKSDNLRDYLLVY